MKKPLIVKALFAFEFTASRTGWMDRRYSLGETTKAYRFLVGKAGVTLSLKYTIIDFYFRPLPF